MNEAKRELDIVLLGASIEHWTRMRDDRGGCGEKPGSAECALCGEYFSGACVGCPIAEKTGQKYCKGTPYYEAHAAWTRLEHHEKHPHSSVAAGPALAQVWRSSAGEMIGFLQRLRKELDSPEANEESPAQ